MHRNSKGPVLRPSTIHACLYLITFFLYLSISYASDINEIHSITSTVRSQNLKQDFFIEQQSEEKGPGYRVGVQVDLVMMYTSVFDKKDHFVKGLKKEDFNLYEDGTRQEIDYFSQVEIPVSMGIVLDLSGSMNDKIEQVNKAARAFIQASNPDDQVFLIGFNDESELLQGFTSDVDEITDALENATTMGGTVLYDAIYLGVEEAHKGNRNKKALVVITDGVDKDSKFTTLKELVTFVQESDVQIFNIGFLDEIPSKSLFGRFIKSDEEKAREALNRISEESGGKAYFPDKVTDIHDIVSEIAEELRNQYSIGFFSSNEKRDGSWRRVVIKLNNNKVSDPKIRHRLGYYAPKE